VPCLPPVAEGDRIISVRHRRRDITTPSVTKLRKQPYLKESIL